MPGTIVHELSHFLVATVLLVRTGDIKLMPEFFDGGVKLGEVGIAKTDPIRKFFIGVAPVIIGLCIIFSLLFVATTNGLTNDWRIVLIIGYLTFVLGNTMFSSKKDLEESWKFFVILIAILAALLVLRAPLELILPLLLSPQTQQLLINACKFLLLPVSIDVVIVAIARFIRG